MSLETIKDDSVSSLVSSTGLPYMEEINKVDQGLLERVPLGFVRSNMVLPIMREGDWIVVAVAHPGALFALDDLRRIFSAPVRAVLVPQAEILNAIHRFYNHPTGSALEVIGGLNGEDLKAIASEFEEPKDLLDLIDEAPIIRLLNSLIFQAVKERASDIHIEPYERDVEIRFRVDGVLYPVLTPPKAIQDAVISRVKIMAGLDIAEKRLPHDGRIRLLVAGKDIDVRVSVIPTTFGERVVLRLLDRKGGIIGLDELGLKPQQVEVMEGLLSRTSGILLATGPTGSGKTTTLYAALNRINSTERNIITVEDPVEYQLKGVGHIQVNPKVGLTFASGLRSILRQDPDVIMIGEIRDRETAEIGIHASLTGHLVLSTLHTNDAPTAITRLVDMGIEPFLVVSSLSAVIAQRLIRLLCPHCKEGYTSPVEGVHHLPEGLARKGLTFYRAIGCERCLNTGYYGRTGIFEFLLLDQELRNTILKNPDSSTIKEHALSKGMKTLREDGLEKVARGLTSLEEVLRVTQGDYANLSI
ncbi:MAG: type II secretion system ATPase GspE [Deltaproteobacteria bacterium]|nr:type II secretion system ATPase GspE [Deltaproteobacteria bacterium]